MWDMNPGGDQTSSSARGRKPLPDGQSRSITYKVRVRPGPAARFEAIAKANRMTVSDALREAMAEWVGKHGIGR